MITRTVNMLKRHEGFRSRVYKCSEGYNTIGYGFNLDDGISKPIASLILDSQVNDLDVKLSIQYGWYMQLDPVRQSVVLNMCFNLGLGGFSSFKKTIEYIESGDYYLAADEMLDSRWAEQVGFRAGELSEMMRTKQWPS